LGIFSPEDDTLFVSRNPALTPGHSDHHSDPFESPDGIEASGSWNWLTALDQFGPALLRDRIKVAVEAPLTGSQANNGQDIWRGTKLAAEQINLAGGVDGKLTQLVAADEQADPGRAVRVVKRTAARGAMAGGGQAGVISIDPITDNHLEVPISILDVNNQDMLLIT